MPYTTHDWEWSVYTYKNAYDWGWCKWHCSHMNPFWCFPAASCSKTALAGFVRGLPCSCLVGPSEMWFQPVASGKQTKSYGKWPFMVFIAIEPTEDRPFIDDLPIKNGDFPKLC